MKNMEANSEIPSLINKRLTNTSVSKTLLPDIALQLRS